MNERPIPRSRLLLARGVAALMLALVLGGIAWYGVAPETLARVWRNLVDRSGGPFAFRFALQPTMAAIAALADGLRDARLGRPPFWATVLHDPAQRAARLDEASVATARILLLGLVIDALYQWRLFDAFHPAEAVAIALALALLPYLALRGSVTRVARRFVGPRGGPARS